jgi:hypothetical protein
MNKTRTFLSVMALISTAACSGGGGGSTPPTSAGTSPQTSGASSTSPSAVLDQSTSPATLTINIPDIGMNHAFTLTGDNLQNATLNGAPISNLINTPDGSTNFAIKRDGQDVLVYDAGDLSFSRYGIWSHSDASGKVLAVGSVAAGTRTPAADIPVSGSASYAGGVVATGTNGTGNLNLTGTFNALVNFANRGLGFNSNLYSSDAGGTLHPWGSINGSASIAAGSSAFAGSVTSSGAADQLSGTMNGSFFGSGAKEIGGVFDASGGQTRLVGAFGGSVQAPQTTGAQFMGAGFAGTATTGVSFNTGSGGSVNMTGTLPSGSVTGSFGTMTSGSTSAPGGGAQGTFFGSTPTTTVGAFGAAKH